MKNISLLLTLTLFSNFTFNIKANESLKKGDYILLYDGENSFTAASKVHVELKGDDIAISGSDDKSRILILKREGNGKYTMDFNDPVGEFIITGKILPSGFFIGRFNVKASESAKKRYYQDDTGEFKLIPYSEEKFSEVNKAINDKLYDIKKYANIEEMAKVSPYAREILEENKKIKQQERKSLYGRVIDQFNDPVVGAKVTVSVADKSVILLTYTDWPRETLICTSDMNGFFNLKNLKSNDPTIRLIEKKGYDSIKNIHVNLWKNANTPINLITIKMRKKGDNPTYLIKHDGNMEFGIEFASGEDSFYSFIDLSYTWREKIQEDFEQKYEKDFVPLPGRHDFKVNGVFDKDKSEWRVTFTAAGEEGGFILGDSFLDEAPSEGYQKEFTFTQTVKTRELEGEIIPETTDFALKGKYLYIRSRDPAIYTRMRFRDDYAYAKFDTFSIRTETATNPYGERNLEFDDSLPLNIEDACGNVYKYFLANELPPKPDMKKLWEEFKKTHEQVEDPETGEMKWREKKKK